jgi:hypothetical protein
MEDAHALAKGTEKNQTQPASSYNGAGNVR